MRRMTAELIVQQTIDRLHDKGVITEEVWGAMDVETNETLVQEMVDEDIIEVEE